jgi:hypothetical protein
MGAVLKAVRPPPGAYALALRTRSTRVVDRSADARFAHAKQERDLGSVRRLDVVLGASLGSMVEALALHMQEAEVRHVVSAVALDEVASVATRGSSSRSARPRTLGVRSLGGECVKSSTPGSGLMWLWELKLVTRLTRRRVVRFVST